MDVEPVGLGECMRNAGFDLRGERWHEGEAGGDNGCNHYRGKRFDHDSPLLWASRGPSFGWGAGYLGAVSERLRAAPKWFHPTKVLFRRAFQNEMSARRKTPNFRKWFESRLEIKIPVGAEPARLATSRRPG